MAGESSEGGAKYWRDVGTEFPRKFKLTATESREPKLTVPLLHLIEIDGFVAENVTVGQLAAVATIGPPWSTCQLRKKLGPQATGILLPSLLEERKCNCDVN